MTETIKTFVFIVIAGGLLAGAWFARPAAPGRAIVDDKGEPFFPAFVDPLDAASLEILEFDEDSGIAAAFKVARHEGVWSIPSHENYPADAENQFAQAVASMIGLRRGTRVTDSPSEHEQYGVVDPAGAAPGVVGIGKRVTLAADDGRPLADLIIGKELKESRDQRFVRLPGIDRVYLCTISTEHFSTNFEEWIEKDLLTLSPQEITGVQVNDYSIDEINGRILQGGELKLEYSTSDYKWSLDDLAADEELDDVKLNELRNALTELSIVDVHRKPGGLSTELLTTEAMQLDAQAVDSLRRRGYFIVQGRLLSNEGETVVRTRDGVRYMLRFGEIALTQGAGASEEGQPAADTGRYLFITAELDESQIAEPTYAEIPDPAAMGVNLDGDGEDAAASATLRKAFDDARAQIEQDNQSKREAWEQQLQDARARADELNARFADWYYVISDPVYQKIRLTRADVVKPKQNDEAATG